MILISSILFLFLYCAGGLYFSSQVISFKTYSLEIDEDRNGRKSYRELGLPEPQIVSVPVGDGYLKGFLFTFNKLPRCAVIFQHGHKGTRYGMLKYMPLFKSRRCALLSLDARYHGKSVGDFGTYGFYEQHDHRRVFHWIKQRYRLRDKQIGFVGESMGAAISLMAASQLGNLAFVIADSPYADLYTRLKEGAGQLYGSAVLALLPAAMFFAQWQAQFNVDSVDVALSASQVQSPMLIIHSVQDDYTLPHHAQKIYKSIQHENRELHLTNWQAKHAKNINVNYQGYRQIVERFLRRYAASF